MESVTQDSPIVEGLTYRRPNLKDFTLDDNDLVRTCPLDNYKHHLEPKHDLGILETLPLELLGLVLVQIDLRSLTDFRRINNRAMQVVDSILEYRLMHRHTSNLIRGILSVELGSHVSVQALFKTLNEFKCEECGDFAGFVYLTTCRRVCFLCLYEKSRYFPLLISEAEWKFGVSRRLFAALPAVKSLPGCYSPNEYVRKARLTLLDSESARQIAIKYHGTAEVMEQHVAEAGQKRWESYQWKVAGDSGTTSRRRPGISVQEGRRSDPRRFMAVVRAPWIKPSSNAVEWGFHCVGCKRQYRSRPLHWRRKYCVETFSDHIRECRSVRDGEHHLDGRSSIAGYNEASGKATHLTPVVLQISETAKA
jgi:hypothetical protein